MEPPTLTEQTQDLVRQEQLKVLAAQADARWEAKARLVDVPTTNSGMGIERALPALGLKDGQDGRAVEGVLDGEGGVDGEGPPSKELEGEMQSLDGKRHSFTRGERTPRITKEEKDPWRKARGGPSEEWQPEAWDPNAVVARR